MDFPDAPVYRRTVSRYALWTIATIAAAALTLVMLGATIWLNVANRDVTVLSVIPATATCGALLLLVAALERAWGAKD